MKKTLYNEDFYVTQQQGSFQSAQVVVPMIMDLIQPTSIIDVGCGVGTWLSVFNQCGIDDYLGVDGAYVDPNMLMIDQDKFQAFEPEQPIDLNREFDLVVSLEVAEHISIDFAEGFIKNLTQLGPVVMFSAAIPYQGGTGHVNEQWPEYWRDYFYQYGYSVFDIIRSKIWNYDTVDYWYRQNIFLYIREDCIDRYPKLQKEVEAKQDFPLAVVHPQTYLLSLGINS
ncbi:methyltransferase domain-containing protein [Roseofilum capinflatum]|uniref:Methyltransferase domain-containing protein n=1 Tax=Roseofilum capinflatum BLCC-M114 TaxID=3022440 RepID=A0ABT7BCW5_9CYAN|nr:methyltransferase domain-containing protein [Roseofilum capinflatum]MDJ1177029.1 methyltransferase domain-containing protein [Roseofilum capinflatum BLCC-M114]